MIPLRKARLIGWNSALIMGMLTCLCGLYVRALGIKRKQLK